MDLKIAMRINDCTSLLAQKGWINFKIPILESPLEYLYKIANQLGEPIAGRGRNIFEYIRPSTTLNARLSSLSKKYGLDVLPLHCDTAHWLTPCRYIILACINPGLENTRTILLDTTLVNLTVEEQRQLHYETFLFQNGRKSFYGNIYSIDRSFVRLDPGCMVPLSEQGYDIMSILSYSRNVTKVKKIEWCAAQVIIIDNWRVLHGRESVNVIDNNRLLLRIMVQ